MAKTRTDIEAFVEASGRDKLVKEVRKKIDALGIEYLYLQFVSVTGRIVGKGIPSDHWESIAKHHFDKAFVRSGWPNGWANRLRKPNRLE